MGFLVILAMLIGLEYYNCRSTFVASESSFVLSQKDATSKASLFIDDIATSLNKNRLYRLLEDAGGGEEDAENDNVDDQVQEVDDGDNNNADEGDNGDDQYGGDGAEDDGVDNDDHAVGDDNAENNVDDVNDDDANNQNRGNDANDDIDDEPVYIDDDIFVVDDVVVDDDFYAYDEDKVDRLFPMDGFEIIGFLLVSMAIIIAVGGGISGGGMILPIYIIVMGLKTNVAIPLTSVTIFGSSVASMMMNWRRRHPFADRPLIDWDLVMVMEPLILVGMILGSLLQRSFSEKLQHVLLIIFLSTASHFNLKKAKKLRNAEEEYIKRWREQQYDDTCSRASTSTDKKQPSPPKSQNEDEESYKYYHDFDTIVDSFYISKLTKVQITDTLAAPKIEDDNVSKNHSDNKTLLTTTNDDINHQMNEDGNKRTFGEKLLKALLIVVLGAASTVHWKKKAEKSNATEEKDIGTLDEQQYEKACSSKSTCPNNNQQQPPVEAREDQEGSYHCEVTSPVGKQNEPHINDELSAKTTEGKHVDIDQSKTETLIDGINNQISDDEKTNYSLTESEKAYIRVSNPDFVSLHSELTEEVKITPRKKVLAVGCMFSVLIFLTCIVGGGDHESPFGIECGTFEYWILNVFTIFFLISFAWGAQTYLVMRHEIREIVNFDYIYGDIKWDVRKAVIFPILFCCAGLMAGMFGIGGGIVTTPLMLTAMGIHPEVAAATSATMALFTSLASTTSYAVFGLIYWDFAAACCIIGFGSSLFGQHIHRHARHNEEVNGRTLKRTSMIAYSVGGVLLLSAVLFTISYVFTLATYKNERHLGSVCERYVVH